MAQDTDEARVRTVVDSLCSLIQDKFGLQHR
jgi:hypothetical protein